MTKGIFTRLRLSSLRLRLVVVFALVALTAAVAASGIAYWLNREAVLTRTQDGALNDFRQEMQNRAATLPLRPTEDDLRRTAEQMAGGSSANYQVLLLGERAVGKPIVGASDPDDFTLADVPRSLRDAVDTERPVTEANPYPYHLFWQRTERDGTPYLVGGTRIDGGGPAGYMFKSLAAEKADLNSLGWSLGIATALAVAGSVLLAQVAATTVLRPVHRLGEAAKQLGEGKLDTRLRVTGADELADLTRTFNSAAESLQKKVADMSAREESSRRFVADMSHELRTPLTALTAVTEVLEDEQDSLDPMIAPAVALVVSETRRLNDLVENLMEVTRFDAGTARLVLDEVDIADQITACIDARAWLDAVDLDAERGIVAPLDPRRLDVILANLIGNALKHGGSPVRVSVRTDDDEFGDTPTPTRLSPVARPSSRRFRPARRAGSRAVPSVRIRTGSGPAEPIPP
ncbi:histidine kinase dimerization/phospho-acceptor domain-containing protein [Streptomyces narbonensis]